MKHRITAGLLALFVSLSILILPSWPANADPIDRTQTVTLAALSAETDFQFEPATGTISKYIGTSTDVVIPESIDGIPVRVLGKNALAKTGLTSIIFNEGLEVIGEGALSGNATLKTAIFPSSLRRIEKGAFILAGFETVTLNEGLEYLGASAFSNNKHLTSINLPSSLKQIDNLVFQNDIALSGEFQFGRNLGHVGHRVFQKTGTPIVLSLAGAGEKLYLHDELFTASQKSLDIPQGREVMVFARSFTADADIKLTAGTVAITDDMTPKEIEEKIKKTVLLTSGFAEIGETEDTYIETGVDWDTEGLDLTQENVTINGSFPAFPMDAFIKTNATATNNAMAKLKPEVTLAVTKAPDPHAGDFVFDAATGTITSYIGTSTDVVLPERIGGVPVKILAKNSFSKKKLTSIVFNEGLEIIGEGAVGSNNSLTTAVFPSSLRRIEKMAFAAAGFETVTLNEGLEYLGQMAFASNSKLKSINFPSTLKEIESRVFMNDKLLTGDFVLGNELQHVMYQVFYNTEAPIRLSIAKGLGERLYLHFGLFTNSQSSLDIPQNREIMINSRAFGPTTNITLDAGVIDIQSDMTAEEIETKINKYVLLTSGGACLDTAVPSDHSKDKYIESSIDWLTDDLDLTNSSVTVTGKFREIPAEAFTGQTCVVSDITNQELGYLKPSVVLKVEQKEQSFTDEDFTYKTITKNNVAGGSYFGITGLSLSGLKKVAINKDLVLPSKVQGTETGNTGVRSIGGIGQRAFANLGLTSVTLPVPANNEFIIDSSAFSGNALTAIEIPYGVKIIEAAAFYNNKIQSLSLPGTIVKAGSESFCNNQISELLISDDVRLLQLDNYSFAGNKIKSVDMPYSVFKTLENVFINNPGMEKVDETYGVVHLHTRNAAHLNASTFIFSSDYQEFILVGEVEARKDLWSLIFMTDSLEDDDYTDETWSALVDALKEAKVVFADKEASKTELETATKLLGTAIDGLLSVGVNRKELARQISRLTELNARLYTEDSFGQLTTQLTAARNQLADPEATQQDIDGSIAKLFKFEELLIISEAYRWNAEDFTYDGASITGYSPLGVIKFPINKDLILPDKTPDGLTVTDIAREAFAISDQDVQLGVDTLTSPTGLTSVKLPASLKTIGVNAFRYNRLTEVIFPQGLEFIGSTAFNGNHLLQVQIPDSVTTMGDGVFSLNNITSFKLSKSMTTVPNGIFSRNISLTSAVIPQGITEIGQAAFTGAPLTSLSLPDSLRTIRSRAFQANRLTTLEIPGSVEILESNSFEQNVKWRNLTSLTLNEGLSEIGSAAFKGSLLSSVVLPYSLKKLHDRAFLDTVNSQKESVVVKLYSYNPAHVDSFSGSDYHEIILLKASTEALEELIKEALVMKDSDAYIYDDLSDQTQFDNALMEAQVMLSAPTTQIAMDEALVILEQAMTIMNGVKPGGSAPGTTTPAPGTTTPAPGTTTPAPGTTTPAPGTTTPAPGTTTPAPGTTTPAPGTTTPEPGTTTPEPGITKPVPGTTPSKPGDTTPLPNSKPDEPTGPLPNAGNNDSTGLPVLGTLLLMAGLILFLKKTRSNPA